jgi:type IV pilus assembly protein PilA
MIELMVVVLIIAILIAIAIPTFVGARTRATDRHAQSILRNGLTAALVDYADTQTFAGIGPAELDGSLSELSFVAADTPAEATGQEVSVANGTTGGSSFILLASGSRSGECFALLQPADETPRYQSATAPTCAADDFNPAAGTWADSW